MYIYKISLKDKDSDCVLDFNFIANGPLYILPRGCLWSAFLRFFSCKILTWLKMNYVKWYPLYIFGDVYAVIFILCLINFKCSITDTIYLRLCMIIFTSEMFSFSNNVTHCNVLVYFYLKSFHPTRFTTHAA